jgi:hypothetical protein
VIRRAALGNGHDDCFGAVRSVTSSYIKSPELDDKEHYLMTLDPSNGFPATSPGYVETMGDALDQNDEIIEAVDTTMRAAYDAHIVRVGQNIYPMLYVDFTLYGGRYTLVQDDSRIHVRLPDLRGYAQLKSIAHIPLGIFVQIGEYAAYPGNGQWIAPLQAYRAQLVAAQAQVNKVTPSLNAFERSACQSIFTKSLSFIDGILGAKTFTLEAFRTYTASVTTEIQFCMKQAGVYQVTGMTEVVRELKQILGSKWDDVYVVVAAIWTLTKENIHELIIKHQMREERRETHVIVSEAVPTLDDARTLLGRIVGDRVIGEYVFNPNGTPAEKENIYSISTSRDLLSQVAKEVLGSPPIVEEVIGSADFARLCPHLAQKQADKSP